MQFLILVRCPASTIPAASISSIIQHQFPIVSTATADPRSQPAKNSISVPLLCATRPSRTTFPLSSSTNAHVCRLCASNAIHLIPRLLTAIAVPRRQRTSLPEREACFHNIRSGSLHQLGWASRELAAYELGEEEGKGKKENVLVDGSVQETCRGRGRLRQSFARAREKAPARRLSDHAESRLVDAGPAVLLRVRNGEVDESHPISRPVSDPQAVASLGEGRERGLVQAGARLLEQNGPTVGQENRLDVGKLAKVPSDSHASTRT